MPVTPGRPLLDFVYSCGDEPAKFRALEHRGALGLRLPFDGLLELAQMLSSVHVNAPSMKGMICFPCLVQCPWQWLIQWLTHSPLRKPLSPASCSLNNHKVCVESGSSRATLGGEGCKVRRRFSS